MRNNSTAIWLFISSPVLCDLPNIRSVVCGEVENNMKDLTSSVLSSVNFHAASLAFCVALHYYTIISFSLFFLLLYICCRLKCIISFSPRSCKLGRREWSQYLNSGKFCWLQRTKSISSTDTVNFTVFSVNTQHCFSCSTQLSHCTLFPPTADSLFYELAVEHSGSLSA